MDVNLITIVSGLPRSGTSMMMQILEAAGYEVLTDHIRQQDEDNPRGYYEYEPVKKTKEDSSWLQHAGGKAVKMIYRLLYDLPSNYTYKVVFMQRDLGEVLASQSIMLERLGKQGADISDEKLSGLFRQQLDEFERWIAAQSNFSILYVPYKNVVTDTVEQCKRIKEFLGLDIDVRQMAAAVDPDLYRNRQP